MLRRNPHHSAPVTTTDASAQHSDTAAVRTAYERYLRAFLDGDLAAVEALVRFPLAYIGAGETHLLDRFPVSPQALRERKQWHTTVNADYEVSLVAPDKAHVILRGAGARGRLADRDRGRVLRLYPHRRGLETVRPVRHRHSRPRLTLASRSPVGCNISFRWRPPWFINVAEPYRGRRARPLIATKTTAIRGPP